ncbi:MAG: peptidoglycan-binding protein [Oscillospiraceae bacterium]|nr:peptidoglycan-binding protein [Oscillospiraceae bacterium]
MLIPRYTRPEAGNRYYIRRISGGWSTAIQGSPTDAVCDVLHNCVGYAVGRFHEIANRPQFDLLDAVNAENLFANAQRHGLQTGNVPKPGALIVWQKGDTLQNTDGAGHVAVVEAVTEAYIITSESGYGAAKPFWTTRRVPPYAEGKNYRLLGFIYQPETPADEEKIPAEILRKGTRGSAVMWMQKQLAARGYLRNTEIDGDFGNITLGALCGFQLEHHLTVDGICGPLTRQALGQTDT